LLLEVFTQRNVVADYPIEVEFYSKTKTRNRFLSQPLGELHHEISGISFLFHSASRL